ncbi:AMP-binding protein [Nocardia pseudovaccinii]|uniref:AMP-binding protein n=1 Tax=Nocardia pseudovaccinii TaxID=189540 RepID=UPI0007A4C87B|nr:AMP-binding protein [Nocardia pseudovaccinii]
MRPTDGLDRGAHEHPDQIALICGEESITYVQLRDLSCRIAQTLGVHGFRPGDHGAVLAPNDIDGFACALGLMRAGLTWIPLNPYDAIPQVGQLLQRLDADVLFLHSAYREHTDALSEAAPGIREMIIYDTDLDSWLGDAPAEDVSGPGIGDPDAIAAIYPTSGTTGLPRGVMHDNRRFAFFISALSQQVQYDADQPTVFLAAAPLTHVSGRIALATLYRGGTVVILHRPALDTLLDTLERHRVDTTMLPPTVLYAIVDMPGIEQRRFPALRQLIYGAAPMRLDKLEQALKLFGPIMRQGYGQTEAPMLITALPAEEHFVDGKLAPEQRLSSIGRPTSVSTVAILGDDGHELAQGEVGEICVRGEFVMVGYYKDPEATAEVSRGGWHHTGDAGYIDAEGYIHLVDRKKDLIISGGFNVYPAEVERVIGAVPGVAEVAVIGVPDQRWGEAVTAVVVAKPGQTVDEQQIIDHTKATLGSVKAPKHVDVWDVLPRNATGKVLKRAIREHYEQAGA